MMQECGKCSTAGVTNLLFSKGYLRKLEALRLLANK